MVADLSLEDLTEIVIPDAWKAGRVDAFVVAMEQARLIEIPVHTDTWGNARGCPVPSRARRGSGSRDRARGAGVRCPCSQGPNALFVRRSLNSRYIPRIEVAPDADKECRRIALAHIQEGHGIDVFASLDMMETNNPHGCEMQGTG